MAAAGIQFLLALLSLLLLVSGVFSTSFTFVNKCGFTVWPGILSNGGVPPLPTTGFSLQTGESKTLPAPASWGGRFWGRTLCSEDSTGKFTCATGDCGSNKLECAGNGATPPATLAEFTLDGSGGLDFFDVSLVDGYNLPMIVVPQGGSGDNCTSTGCVVDLNGACPSELRVTSADGREGVACKSACDAFNQPQYCCTGAYQTPDTCQPSMYSQIFKRACPRAYSYAYDDKTSTFTCASADYVITFCPSPNTRRWAFLSIFDGQPPLVVADNMGKTGTPFNNCSQKPKGIGGTEFTGDGEPIFRRRRCNGLRRRISDPNRRSAATRSRDFRGRYGCNLVVVAAAVLLLLTCYGPSP